MSGAYTKYNTPADHPKNYRPHQAPNVYDVRPDEALYELKTMLFDYADAEAIIDFIEDVQVSFPLGEHSNTILFV